MQVQTTINIETEIAVFCDCCHNQSTGTKTELEDCGWGFAEGAEFCSDCN